MALQIIALGSKAAGPLSNVAVPFLATTFGWRSVAYVYGSVTAVFAAAWHLCASEEPPGTKTKEGEEQEEPAADGAREEMTESERSTSLTAGSNGRHGKLRLVPAKDSPSRNKRRAIEWAIFGEKAVWSTFFMHLAENNAYYAMMQLSPQIYTSLLGVAPGSLQNYLAIPPALNVCGSFVIAAIDGLLHRRQMPLLQIQKLMSMLGATVEAIFLTAFAVVLWVPRLRSPVYATIASCGVIVGHLCHASGLFTNYQDVGGPDSSVIISVCNPLANIAGVLVPAGSTFFLNRTGSFAPYFVIAAVAQLAAGLNFVRNASVTPARELVEERRRRRSGSEKMAAQAT